MSDLVDYIIKSNIDTMEEFHKKITLFVNEESIYQISRKENVIFLVKMTKEQARSLKNIGIEMSIDKSLIKCK
jgi:hypothetical protein